MNLRLCFLAACLALAACGSREPTAPDAKSKRVVYVYNWSDYIAEDTVKNFEAATGIQVVYDVYDSNETLDDKLKAGASGYDVVFPSARPFAERQIKSGLYAELDKSRLPNLGNLDPGLMHALDRLDPENRHVLPYFWGTTGLGINVKKVKEILGDNAPLDSWSLLFDPNNAKKLAACGISVVDDEQDAFGSALIWLGKNPNEASAAQNEAVKQAFAAIRPYIRHLDSSSYIDDLANGEVCLVLGYSGDVFQAADRANEAGNGVEVEYVIPREGAMRWVDVMAIPVDAPHAANAHAFINFLLRPEIAAAIGNYVSYATPNAAAMSRIDPDLANDPSVYPKPETMSKLVDPVTFGAKAQTQREAVWAEIKSGH